MSQIVVQKVGRKVIYFCLRLYGRELTLQLILDLIGMPESFNRINGSRKVLVQLPTHPKWVAIIERRLLRRSGAILDVDLTGLTNIPGWISCLHNHDTPTAVVRLEKHDGLEYRMILRPNSRAGKALKTGLVLTINLNGVLTFFVEQPMVDDSAGPAFKITPSLELVVPESDDWKQLQADLLVDSLVGLLGREVTKPVSLANLLLQKQVRGTRSP